MGVGGDGGDFWLVPMRIFFFNYKNCFLKKTQLLLKNLKEPKDFLLVTEVKVRVRFTCRHSISCINIYVSGRSSQR